MAKRRRINTPSQEVLKALEEGFARETPGGPADTLPGIRAPMSQVAGEAAALYEPQPVAARAADARDQADAKRYRDAAEAGRLVTQVPVALIVVDELSRDRMALHGEEMAELKASIAAHGMRLPVELFELVEPTATEQYGLISGYRRVQAIRALLGETGEAQYKHIKALIRQPASVSDAYVAMVEENEIRADLSQYERGRIAVLAARQGIYASPEAAVDVLFHTGSKAKRSKIRSFAVIHEELGDLLTFPTQLSERAGLRLAGALRAGLIDEIRLALRSGQGTDPEREWQVMEPYVLQGEKAARDPARGGRPRQAPRSRRVGDGQFDLVNGMSITSESDDRGYAIRFHGKAVNAELIHTVMLEIRRLLEPL
jgi:ParB family transcriptional regulator, chromosome partitioning protein